MLILGIETSCDDTSAAVIQADIKTSFVTQLANTSATSLQLHAKTGGIIPEIAAREQIKYSIPVIKHALEKANKTKNEIDAIAITYGPGLIGSLLVGVETAKTLAFAWDKPLIPVNHLFGHIYANWIDKKEEIQFPAIALIVSGGHTDLMFMKNHGDTTWLGGTRDDAAGEAIDKIGRAINFPYPSGPAFEKAAQKGNPKAYRFPRPLMHDKLYDFSFSGLKTAALREIQKYSDPFSMRERVRVREKTQRESKTSLENKTINDLARGVQDAIIHVLLYKTFQAVEAFGVRSILLGGGVAANQALREAFVKTITEKNWDVTFYAPEKSLCTDNAAMIAAAGFYMGQQTTWENVTANPELYFEE